MIESLKRAAFSNITNSTVDGAGKDFLFSQDSELQILGEYSSTEPYPSPVNLCYISLWNFYYQKQNTKQNKKPKTKIQNKQTKPLFLYSFIKQRLKIFCLAWAFVISEFVVPKGWEQQPKCHRYYSKSTVECECWRYVSNLGRLLPPHAANTVKKRQVSF